MENKQKKKYVRYKDGAEMYGMGITSFMKLAKEAKAVYKIRNIALVNIEILDEYMELFRIISENPRLFNCRDESV